MADAEETPRDEEYPELLSLRDNFVLSGDTG